MSIRIVLGSMPSPILGEIVQEIAQHRGMDVVADDIDRSRLDAVVEEHKADVVIMGLEYDELPKVCRKLLRKFPNTLVVGVASDGKQLAFHALHVNNIGVDELVETIRAALRIPKGSPDDGRHSKRAGVT